MLGKECVILKSLSFILVKFCTSSYAEAYTKNELMY